MNKQTLMWALIIAVPVSLAALATGYMYRETGKLPFEGEKSETAAPQTASKGDKAPAVAAAPEADDTASPDQTAEASKTEDTPSAEAAAGPVKPSFDVVGIEPTGETVVAGRSEPGAIVALTANGDVVGKSIANGAGEWTIILDEPLKPGDYDVGLEVHDQGGDRIEGSEERVAVSIPEDGKEQPLVVLNKPDGPSDILQKPETSAPQAVAEATGADTKGTAKAEETVVAAAPVAAPADAGASSEENAAARGARDDGAPVETETAAAGQGQRPSAEPASDNAAPEPADSTDTASAEGGQETGAGQTAATTGQTADAAPSSAATEDEPAETQQEVATASEATASPADSAEDEPVGAQADSGAAAEEKPESASGEQQVATASQEAPAASAGGSAASEETAEPAPSVTVEAVESEKDKVYVAGTGDPGSSVRVYVGDDFQGEAKVNSSGKWLVEGDKNVAEGNVEVRADVIGEDGNSVDARAAVVFEKEQDQQIVLTKVVASGSGSAPDGQGADVQKALPVVIIRKGDNLWRISRRLYGDGIRYTTIYQANQDQIRNPDLIYPGQVFLTPEGDLNWPKPEADNGGNG